MKMTAASAFALSVGLLTGAASSAAVAQEAPLITVLIKPHRIDRATSSGPIDVTMTLPAAGAAAGQPLLSMGLFTPGLARSQVLSDLVVTDAAGPVEMVQQPQKDSPHQWAPKRAIQGQATVRYRLLAENIPALAGGPPTALRVDGDAISGIGSTMIMRPHLTGDHRIAINWDTSAMAPGSEGVSSYGDGDVSLPAGPISRLDRAIYMAGPLERESGDGAFSAVWVKGQPPFDPHASMQWTGKLYSYMSRFFRDKVEPPYRVFLRFNPMNAGGGAALTNSFVVTYGKGVTGESIKAILGHEMTHTWTSGGMDKWYSEGNAVYYQALLPWRAGLFTSEQYLQDLNETAYRYFSNALRHTPDSEIVPRFWEDTRIRVLPYDRGAMYFAVLNGKVVRASGGKRSIDDLILPMVQRERDGLPLTEAIWLELLEKELGSDGLAVHKAMLAGELMAPEAGDFGPCFTRATKKMPRFDLGFDNAAILSNPKVIKGLKSGSAAEKAGLRNGDQVTYAVALDAVQGDLGRTLDLTVTRDGKTFPVSYKPRGDLVDTFQWERVAGASDPACKS